MAYFKCFRIEIDLDDSGDQADVLVISDSSAIIDLRA